MSPIDPRKIASERPSSFEAESFIRYKFSSRYAKNKHVLDIGCGLGFGSNFLATGGAFSVIGLDNNMKAIEYSKSHFVRKNIQFICGSALEIKQLKKKFDVILAFEVIEHLPKNTYSSFVSAITDSLTHKGICIISTPNKLVTSPNTDKPSNPFHTKEFEPKEFENLCIPHFKQCSLFGLVCTNVGFLRRRVSRQQAPRKRFVTFISSFRIIHLLLPYIPLKLKNAITKQDQLPQLSSGDFSIVSKNIDTSDGLLIVCKK